MFLYDVESRKKEIFLMSCTKLQEKFEISSYPKQFSAYYIKEVKSSFSMLTKMLGKAYQGIFTKFELSTSCRFKDIAIKN